MTSPLLRPYSLWLLSRYKHLVMFEAYFDESGDPSDPKIEVFTLAWLVAPARKWREFDLKWNRILRRFNVSMLHMKDYEHRRGEFEGWDENKAVSFISQLASILKSTIRLGHSHSLSVEVWRKFVAHNVEKKYEEKRAPYIFLLQSCLEDLAEYGKTLPNGERIACIFDENNFVRFDAASHYALLKQKRKWDMLQGATFENKRDFIPLQAADMLAYESYKDVMNIKHGIKRPRRKLLTNLMNSKRIKLAIFDLKSFLAHQQDLEARGIPLG